VLDARLLGEAGVSMRLGGQERMFPRLEEPRSGDDQ
jgi:hypothetical protein